MTALAHEVPEEVDMLLEGFLQLGTPPGFRAELIEQEIVVSPPPGGMHEEIVAIIGRWVVQRGLHIYTTAGVITPNGRFIPDGAVAPPGTFRNRSNWDDADGIVMVVEVTSSRPDADRGPKRLGYAAAGIPVYLLVDRDEERVTVFSDCRDGDYHHSVSVLFGDELEIPVLEGKLDTSEFK